MRSLIKRCQQWLTVGKVGLLLLVLAVPGIMMPYFRGMGMRQLLVDSYTNFGLELAGIAITVLIIDRLYQQQEDRREKEQLVRQLRSPDQSAAMDAAERLRAQGWLADGTLCKASLHQVSLPGVNWRTADLAEANLQRANLSHADLEGCHLQQVHLQQANLEWVNLQEADLTEANLEGANLAHANLRQAQVTAAQLARADKLVNSMMPGGERYNGRFNLSGDLLEARSAGFNPHDPIAMARFYDVPLDDYQQGQQPTTSNQ